MTIFSFFLNVEIPLVSVTLNFNEIIFKNKIHVWVDWINIEEWNNFARISMYTHSFLLYICTTNGTFYSLYYPDWTLFANCLTLLSLSLANLVLSLSISIQLDLLPQRTKENWKFLFYFLSHRQWILYHLLPLPASHSSPSLFSLSLSLSHWIFSLSENFTTVMWR